MKAIWMVLLLAMSSSSWALECGDWVYADVLPTADIRDCPAEGLVIAADKVTLKHNGFTIDGKGDSAGISLLPHHHVAIVGPGTIRDFATGIAAGRGSKHYIGNLTIESVEQGVYWSEVSDSIVEQLEINRASMASRWTARLPTTTCSSTTMLRALWAKQFGSAVDRITTYGAID